VGDVNLFRISQALGLDERELETRRAYLKIDAADSAVLADLHARLDACPPAFIDQFYDHLLTFPEMRELLGDAERLRRLKRVQQDYFRRLTDGDYGPGYVDERLRIGITHQRIGLAPKWYLGAYCIYLSGLLEHLQSLYPDDPSRAGDAFQVLLKVVFFDLGLVLDTYWHEDRNAVLRADERLRRSEGQYRALVEGASDWLWEVNAHGVYTYASPRVRELLGHEPDDVLGKTPFDFMPPDEANHVSAIFGTFLREQRPFARLEHIRLHRDGRHVAIETSAVPVFDGTGELLGYRGIDRDVTARKHAEEAQRTLASALAQSADLVMIVSRQGVIEYVNPAFCSVTGYTVTEVVGRKPNLLKSGMQDDTYYHRMWHTILAGAPFHSVVINRKKDGSLYYEEKTISPLRDPKSGEITQFVSTGKDITEALALRERLQFLAEYDPVTGLANRERFGAQLHQALDLAVRHQRAVAVLHLDLDSFKVINETLGHEAGDQLLKEIAVRLREAARGDDCVARLSGDDYAVLFADLASVDEVPRLADKILTVLREPFRVAGQEVYVRASVGISLYPDDAADGPTLMRNAETAMYQAKHGGRSQWRFFAAAANARAARRLALETSLHRAIERQEFELHYQPQVDLDSGTIVALEALLRWRPDRNGEPVSPGEFIPVLEETGLITAVGDWVLRTACAQVAAWRAAGLDVARVAVNLSAFQFHRQSLLDTVAQITKETGIPPGMLELEVTESVLLQNAEGALDVLRALERQGVRLGMDDFGTGYSSLSYLKQFPLHTLKIAQPFVHGAPHDPVDCGIIRAVIGIARSLGVSVVAEGVETEAQLSFLRAERCDAVQGYLFSRPVPASEVPALLRSGRRL